MRFCVYTSLIDGYEDLNEQPVAGDSDIPFFCFTNRTDMASTSWSVRPVEPVFKTDPARSQRSVKIRPHLFLPDFDVSLYIDNTVILKRPPEEIVATLLEDGDAQIALFEHSFRNTVMDELKAVYERGIEDPWRLLEFEKHVRSQDPALLDQKLFWGGFILRKHLEPACIDFAEILYAHVLRYSRRDQLSLNIALDRSGVRLQPIRLPNAESQFHKWPHAPGRKQGARNIRFDPTGDFPGLGKEMRGSSRAAREAEVLQARLEAGHARKEAEALQHSIAHIRNSTSWKISAPYRASTRALRQSLRALRKATLRSREPSGEVAPTASSINIDAEARKHNFHRGDLRDIAFLIAPERRSSGSTVLRSQQLCHLVNTQLSDTRRVYLSETADIANAIIILSKGYLETCDVDELEALAKSNVLVADHVDARQSDDKVAHVHALMAASNAACKSYLKQYPDKQAFHVTHHVDLRIPRDLQPPLASLATGYFGMLSNALLEGEIKKHVEVNPVDTEEQDTRWIRKLDKYNLHYCVRRKTGFDGYKPFLKGFIAANCRSNLIVQKAEADAAYYVGDDYPYLLPEAFTPDNVLKMLDFASESFGGPEWNFGLQIMRDVQHRSSLGHVVIEFEQMIASL